MHSFTVLPTELAYSFRDIPWAPNNVSIPPVICSYVAYESVAFLANVPIAVAADVTPVPTTTAAFFAAEPMPLNTLLIFPDFCEKPDTDDSASLNPF